MNEENQVYFVDSDKLPQEALARKHRLEQDASFRTNHMEYMEGMQVIDSDIKDKILAAMDAYDYDSYTAADVERALSHESCTIEDFKALLSPAAAPYLLHDAILVKCRLISSNLPYHLRQCRFRHLRIIRCVTVSRRQFCRHIFKIGQVNVNVSI